MKTPTISYADTSIGELVANDPRKAQIFKSYNIDYCCGGKRTLRDACLENQIKVNVIENELQQLEVQPHTMHNYAAWPLDFLADFIENTHHKYTRSSLSFLSEVVNTVTTVHADRHPELLEIRSHFKALADELEQHMLKEETILFPYIRELVKNELPSPPPFGSIANPIQVMENEHEGAGTHLSAIQLLSHNFTPPEDACTSYRVLYASLEEFVNDLHQHIHLENNILFPRAIDVEAELFY